MKFEWTEQALEGFRNIRSHYYTPYETAEYKKRLLENIQEKIILLGISIPVKKEEWNGSYKIIIDKFIVYYSFSEDLEICYVEYFKHSSKDR
ncbi:type II toxin-antitoxin system RelE/ParE family toxin [Sporosarcina sp. Marseille-Q4063]|uniref:type II toxin-antitoxin system RelE/ParE family toxin n=1 Tax=Sporosarcina sp. Marseille-Q4063 TaxID=2810514 RepID=UPI001BAEF602|nr:type II toxin-antitoxin system RelE/ParE family toxin [Sporosarcina sp. Marseille-Q4063]QUW23089.1 type II toxin-antitoxin system RelE/ParE family toxin [Sporosarcina sp. Marseille-Q4063]